MGHSLIGNRILRRHEEVRLRKNMPVGNASQAKDAGQQINQLRIDQIAIELLNEEFNRRWMQKAGNSHVHPLQEASENGYFFLDRDGRICDAKFVATGLPEAHGRQQARYFLSDFVVFDGALFDDYLDEVFESDTKISCELSFEQACSKNNLGLKLPLYAAVHAVADDEKQFCLVVVEDISSRKIAERKKEQAMLRRHHQVIATAMDGFWMTNAQGVLQEVNEAYAGMSGYTMQELVGMNISQLEVCAEQAEIKAHIDKVMARGQYRFETQHRRKDGSVIDLEVSSTFLPESKEIFVFSHDITPRKRKEQLLQELSAHLLTVREEEKASAAREIHDDLGSTLTALRMDAHWLADKLAANGEATPLLNRVEAMSALLDHALESMRHIITDLRPSMMDDLGLRAALEWEAGQFQNRTNTECKVVCGRAHVGECKLDKTVSINLFRIFQESLTNVARHSGASTVAVECQCEEGEVAMSISDNGCGLPQEHTIAPNSYGLRGMRERVAQLGGKIEFDSWPGNGFSVIVNLPLPAENRVST